MRIPTLFVRSLFLVLCLGFAPAGHAQNASNGAAPPEPEHVRGTVQSFDGHVLTVKTKMGSVALMLPDPPAVTGLKAATMADIGHNDFIGTTAVKNGDGQWQALEVHIFPEAMRGAGEGHYAWDMPESTMTNAAVTGTAKSKNGETLNLTYKGGSTDVTVTPKTKIVAFEPGDVSLLKPGATVFALAVPGKDGKAMAVALVAETDGVKPPM